MLALLLELVVLALALALGLVLILTHWYLLCLYLYLHMCTCNGTSAGTCVLATVTVLYMYTCNCTSTCCTCVLATVHLLVHAYYCTGTFVCRSTCTVVPAGADTDAARSKTRSREKLQCLSNHGLPIVEIALPSPCASAPCIAAVALPRWSSRWLTQQPRTMAARVESKCSFIINCKRTEPTLTV